MNLDSFDLAKLIRIVVAADEFEAYFGKNVGCNADWPLELKADQDAADKITELLNRLQDALKPYRECKRPEPPASNFNSPLDNPPSR